MTLTEIYVENYKVDIAADLSTLMTYTIDDLANFSTRNTAFSKTINLPGTSNNNKIFGNIFSINAGSFYDATLKNVNYNFNAAKTAQCFIFQGNIQVFKGVIRVLTITNDRGAIDYECAVFGELGGIIAKIGSKKLEALDFSAYDHVYSVANIAASWTAAKGSGYYYPLIDYGTYSALKHDWDIRTFRPALYVKEYIDKIFAASGYTYNSDLFLTARFKSLIVPHNTKVLQRSTTNLFKANVTTLTNVISYGFSNIRDTPFTSFSGTLFTADAPKQVFTYTGVNPININISIDFSGNYTAAGSYITGSLLKNGLAVPGAVKVFNQTGPAGSNYNIPLYWVFNIPITLSQNDTIELQFVTSDSTVNHQYTVNARLVTMSIDTVQPTLVPLAPGDTVNLNVTIPKNIRQIDFLASIIKLFNLYVYEDKDQLNVIYLKPYPDFMNTNLANAVDWTYKMDRSKPIIIKPMSELNSRYYEFKYKADSDYYNDIYQKKWNQNYGDYIYDSAFEFANAKNTAELIFSGTPIVGYNGEDKIYPTIFKRTGSTAPIEENTDSNIRIMQSKVTPCLTWNIKDAASVLGSYTNYGYAGHLDDPNAPANDLNFGVPGELYFTLATGALNINQFNVYWSPYMSEITDKDSRLLTATFYLKHTDIHNLDFSKYVFIDGNLFVISKIENYNATSEDTCRVTLLKVIDSNAIATAPPISGGGDLFIDYVATGAEGNTLYLPQMTYATIAAIFQGDKLLVASNPATVPGQYVASFVRGVITFGAALEAGQVVQILYSKP